MMGNAYMPPSRSEHWQTPPDLFARLNEAYQFTLDGAANEENHLVDRWCGPGGIYDSFFHACLAGERVWLNPPYGRALSLWVAYVAKRIAPVTVCLLPARTDTRWFHEWCYGQPKTSIEFLKGRLKFSGQSSAAPFPSMIVTFRK